VAEDLIRRGPEREPDREPGRDDGSRHDELVRQQEAPAKELGPVLGTVEPHKARFRLVFAVLGALLGAAISAAFVLAVSGQRPKEIDWSAWRPSSGGAGGAQQIADHVAPLYRLSSGDQLVGVRGSDLQLADLPVTVAIRGAGDGSIKLSDGDGVLYTLCGLGPKCSIRTGKATIARHLLLRREALELALYSFRYIPGLDQVVVMLPPRKGDPPSQALLFRKDDVKPELDRPLRATFPMSAKTPKSLSIGDKAQITGLTDRRLYQFSVAQAQDARVVLVLDPLVSGGS
jgi:hypothetical protein